MRKIFNIIRGTLSKIEHGRKFRICKNTIIASPENIKVGDYIYIGSYGYINGGGGIEIGNNVLISPRVSIISQEHSIKNRQLNSEKKIIIKDNAWLCINSIILKGVTIGENSIVSAGSVVTKDVPKNVIVAGVPARIIKRLNGSHSSLVTEKYLN